MSNSQIYQKYYTKFKSQQTSLRAGQISSTKCRDIICFIIFCILILAFATIGSYYISLQPRAVWHKMNKNVQYLNKPLTIVDKIITNYWPVFICTIFVSIVLSVSFLLLMRYFTKCMVYSMIISAALLLVAIMVISVLKMFWGVLAGVGSALFFMLLILYCLRNKIKCGIAMLQIAMQLLVQRPKILLAPLFIVLPAILFVTFWIISLMCIQYHASQEMLFTLQNLKSLTQLKFNYTKQAVFYVYWIFMMGFMTIFLYYVMVYLLSNCCGNWYYGNKQLGVCSGISKLSKYHIGSLTFATTVISFLRILKKVTQNFATQQMSQGHSCLSICLCCTSCCFSQIQQLINTLNNYAIITMTITGQSYIQSAKTSIGIIYQDFQLFYITNIISELVQIGGILFATGLPTLIGWGIIQLYGNDQNKDNYQRIIIVLLFFFSSLAISIFFIGMISQISICLDRRFRDIGVTIQDTPMVLQEIDQNVDIRGKKQSELVPTVVVGPESADRFSRLASRINK